MGGRNTIYLGNVSLIESIRSSLVPTGYLQLQNLDVLLQNGSVLRGRISSYYLKQVAQTAVMTVKGVHHVLNNLTGTCPK